MITTLGVKKTGRTLLIPASMLTESTIGSMYVLKIKTNGVPDAKKALETLKAGLEEKVNTKVLYGDVIEDTITIQITGSPFIWAALLTFLPQILSVIGIVVAIIAVYLVVSGIPTWLWGLGAIALFLLLGLPKILPKLKLGGKE